MGLQCSKAATACGLYRFMVCFHVHTPESLEDGSIYRLLATGGSRYTGRVIMDDLVLSGRRLLGYTRHSPIPDTLALRCPDTCSELMRGQVAVLAGGGVSSRSCRIKGPSGRFH
jgi:hypothetical protein